MCRERKARLRSAEREINALKGAIRQVAFAALSANSGNDDDRLRATGELDPNNPNGAPNATAAQTPPDAAAVEAANGTKANGASSNGAAVLDTAGNGDEANGTSAIRAKANGSNVNDTAAKLKDRKTSGRSSSRAHNGAQPSDDVILRGNGSSTPGRKWPLGATWPFRKNGTIASKASAASSANASVEAAASAATATSAAEASGSPSSEASAPTDVTAAPSKPKVDIGGPSEDSEYCI